MKISVVAVCLWAVSFLQCFGQSDSAVVSKSYDGVPFSKFVSEMQSDYGIRLMSNSPKSDSLFIKQKEVTATLQSILLQTFEGTPFSAYFYNEKYVFVLNDYKIYDKVPRYFSIDIPAVAEKQASAIEFLAEEKHLKKVKKTRIHSFGVPVKNTKGKTATLSGHIVDAQTGEAIIGAVIMPEGTTIGASADLDGYFSLEVPMGKYTILVKSLGKEEEKLTVSMYADGNVEVEMRDQTTQLKGINVIGDRVHNVQGIQVGLETMEMKTIKQLPSAMGEVDIIKTAIMLPGVQTVGEGASGFNVRGGSVDQNLILLDGAPIFNSSHLFGFFSVFNQDVIDEFMLYKSGIPSEYGGRVSSVLDVTTQSGKKKKYSALLGVSPVTGRVFFEGPIWKGRTSFLVAARTTYSDWLLKKLDDPRLSNSAGSFWDGNIKLNHKANDKNNIKASFYRSGDYFRLNSDTSYRYSNTCASLQWHHIFNQNLKWDNQFALSQYEYLIESSAVAAEAFAMDYSIGYTGLTSKLSYAPLVNNKTYLGVTVARYSLSPSRINPKGATSLIEHSPKEKNNALDISLFIGDEWRATEKLLFYGGVRINSFMAVGEQDVYGYAQGLPLSDNTRLDTAHYSASDIVQQYWSIEPRVSVRYSLGENNSVKASYNRMSQNLHMLSNTTAVSPTDAWIVSSKYIKPQVGDIVAVGYYQNLKDNIIEASVEVYYKKVHNVLDYKGGAQLLLNDGIETEIIQGKQQAYGVEFLLKKKFGALTGWLGYTYSVSRMKMDSPFKEEQINGGKWYPANHDKPHDITLVNNYKFNRRLSFSNTLTYSTGRPITYPVAQYKFKEESLLHYSDRNEYRVPYYFRWDISMNVEGNLKSKKIAHTYWSVSIYNLTGRDNVYSIFFKADKEGRMQGYQMSIFPRPLLTVAYNIKF